MPEKQAPGKCPKCVHNTLYHNTGISAKNNKPYENYKCSKCDYIQWIPQDEKPKQQEVPGFSRPPGPTASRDVILADLLTELRTIMLRFEQKFDKFLEVSQLGSEQPYDGEPM